jgi:hypothetical protein
MDFSCNKKAFYEVVMLGIKNRLVGLQTFKGGKGKLCREKILLEIFENERRFGENFSPTIFGTEKKQAYLFQNLLD